MPRPIEHRPHQIHPSVYLAEGSVVVGDVTLEENASVWFNAVLRGDVEPIRVGRGSNVQDGAVLHADPGCPCTLGAGVTVGHGAIVHGATIGDDVVVGMGSIVLNGAVVGARSIVGAGAVVPQNMVIPEGSLVLGVPASVKRPTTEAEHAANRRNAERYVDGAAQYRDAQRAAKESA
ncbi:MAG: gamma carbonic anhydrase family protein [Planctomycetia bacterium]